VKQTAADQKSPFTLTPKKEVNKFAENGPVLRDKVFKQLQSYPLLFLEKNSLKSTCIMQMSVFSVLSLSGFRIIK
jgi:hypothetical protein